jgi:hypothetical protein
MTIAVHLDALDGRVYMSIPLSSVTIAVPWILILSRHAIGLSGNKRRVLVGMSIIERKDLILRDTG